MRLDMTKAAPDAYQAMLQLQKYVNQSGIEKPLQELVKLRASQINGCAFCIDLHVRVAVAAGEKHERIHLLNAWREAPVYTEREQAALAWTEAVTLLGAGHVPDDVYQRARSQFDEKELVDLTMAIVAINSWNRLMVAFRKPPDGDYRPS
jgi:AhpD family alkylhydroperoxidase